MLVIRNLLTFTFVTSIGILSVFAECFLTLDDYNKFNAFTGGDNTLQCSVTVTYNDGSGDVIASECNNTAHNGDQCYNSSLPYRICIRMSGYERGDGFLNYGSSHSDFHSPYYHQSKNNGFDWAWHETT